MGTEIERKFLVVGEDWRTANPVYICQGYLSHDPDCTVRVRVKGDDAYLTIKGKSRGATRAEYEYCIPAEEARDLLKLCKAGAIEKYRHIVRHGGTTWEVDEFLGDNAGLVVAEIELPSEDADFARPHWIGKDVTGDPRYFNASLSRHPYGTWKEGI